MKFSYTKNPEREFFFIKNPNLTKKKILAVGRGGGGGGGVARVSDFFSFFKRIQVWKKQMFSF